MRMRAFRTCNALLRLFTLSQQLCGNNDLCHISETRTSWVYATAIICCAKTKSNSISTPLAGPNHTILALAAPVDASAPATGSTMTDYAKSSTQGRMALTRLVIAAASSRPAPIT
ncbi:hypothetical protein C8Q78DRAFT_1031585 [Trametes maxima]|nr:hypothetical protein C8Q78DRAFT_1031585 [Trametes maxima]